MVDQRNIRSVILTDPNTPGQQAAIDASGLLQIDIADSAVDLMLGTDFSNVLGTASLITTTQADNLANTTDTLNTSAFLYAFDGSTWDRMLGDSTDGLLVNLGTNNDVTITGTVTVDLGANNDVQGQSAHDAATSGNPFIVAGEAQNVDDTAPPNRVTTEGDTTQLATDFDGSVFVRPHGPQIWSYHSDGSTALTDATVHAAPGAGLSLYVTDIVFSSGAATAINAFFEESTTTVLGPYYLEAVAGRGVHIKFQTPKKITANTALTVTTSASIAHSVDVTGFVGQG